MQSPIAIIGLPGSGKSKVARLLAKHLGTRAIDTDVLVAKHQGKPITEIFADDGEEEFRRLEELAVRDALESGAVVSLGGGAVETPGVQRMLEGVTVVHIDADDEVILERVGRDNSRPLFRGDAADVLAQLRQRRDPLYESLGTIKVRSTRGPAGEVVEQILHAIRHEQSIWVDADGGYPLFVSERAVAQALAYVPPQATKALLVAPAVMDTAAQEVEKALVEAASARGGIEVFRFVPEDGESQKTVESAATGWDILGQAHFGRKDVVIGLGGGATTDLAGFLAATWARGIAVIQIPTSLLAMVDAAVGGKTGINSAWGKNLIGSFHSPLSVGINPLFLQTLPPEEYISGLGELLKCGFIYDPEILKIAADNPRLGDRDWATTEGRSVLEDLIVRAVEVKAQVVGKDLKEDGLREILNYGHTLAHAIESESNYQVRHGEAVAIGACFAAFVAHRAGMLSTDEVMKHQEVFSSVGLPTTWRGDFERLLSLMQSDKKTRGGELRFVLLDGIGNPVTKTVSERELALAWSDFAGEH